MIFDTFGNIEGIRSLTIEYLTGITTTSNAAVAQEGCGLRRSWKE